MWTGRAPVYPEARSGGLVGLRLPRGSFPDERRGGLGCFSQYFLTEVTDALCGNVNQAFPAHPPYSVPNRHWPEAVGCLPNHGNPCRTPCPLGWTKHTQKWGSLLLQTVLNAPPSLEKAASLSVLRQCIHIVAKSG